MSLCVCDDEWEYIIRQFKDVERMSSHNKTISSFPPIAMSDAVVLVLGSMPSETSLDAHQYYAHPRNAFWPIIRRLFGNGDEASYDERRLLLTANRIALWDVMQSCVRRGSLDAAIERESIVANDFASFFTEHPSLRWLFFNGGEAERSFRRHVLPTLDSAIAIEMQRLPSTSPAHASLTREQKLQRWRQIRDVLQR